MISDLKSRLHIRQYRPPPPPPLPHQYTQCPGPKSGPSLVKFPSLHCATLGASVATGPTANTHQYSLSHSYEETLFRALPRGSLVPFTADLVISRPASHGLCHMYRERLHLSAGLVLPHAAGPLPFCCRHRLSTPLLISRRRGVTLQLVIRHGETGVVGKVFLLRLDVGDMPERSQTLIRQKHYYCNSKDGRPVLQHALQLSVTRGEGSGTTRLQGSIRLIFSFNQAATIGGTEWKSGSIGRDGGLGSSPSPARANGGEGTAEGMCERLHIVTEYPLPGKYAPLLGPTLSGAPRLSPHGAIH